MAQQEDGDEEDEDDDEGEKEVVLGKKQKKKKVINDERMTHNRVCLCAQQSKERACVNKMIKDKGVLCTHA